MQEAGAEESQTEAGAGFVKGRNPLRQETLRRRTKFSEHAEEEAGANLAMDVLEQIAISSIRKATSQGPRGNQPALKDAGDRKSVV